MKKIFTLMAVALVAMTASAQEKVLFEDGVEYGNGATLTSESTTLVLGNDRATKNYDIKLSTCKAYCAELFGQTVMVENSSGELEPKTRVVYAVGANNPKDSLLNAEDKSAGASFDPALGNLPQSGTYYMITPQKAGHVNAYIILNADKALFPKGACSFLPRAALFKEGMRHVQESSCRSQFCWERKGSREVLG